MRKADVYASSETRISINIVYLGILPVFFMLMLIMTDVAKFLSVTLKRVSLPSDASAARLSLMKKLDELQQSYPQLY